MIKQIILAFFGSVFPVILFNIDRKKIGWAGLCGALGWAFYLLTIRVTHSTVMSSFIGAFIVGLYSEFMARKLKTPASEFSVPGIFPLVPGLAAYSTVKYIVEHKLPSALSKGMQTVGVGGAIGFGIMLSSAIVAFVSKLLNKNKQITE